MQYNYFIKNEKTNIKQECRPYNKKKKSAKEVTFTCITEVHTVVRLPRWDSTTKMAYVLSPIKGKESDNVSQFYLWVKNICCGIWIYIQFYLYNTKDLWWGVKEMIGFCLLLLVIYFLTTVYDFLRWPW